MLQLFAISLHKEHSNLLMIFVYVSLDMCNCWYAYMCMNVEAGGQTWVLTLYFSLFLPSHLSPYLIPQSSLSLYFFITLYSISPSLKDQLSHWFLASHLTSIYRLKYTYY